MRKRLALVLLLAIGCGGGEVVSAEPRLFAPEVLDFGPVLVATKETRSIALRNDGRGSTPVRARVSPPFEPVEEEIVVPGRATRNLAFSIFAEEEGTWEEVALLEWAGGTVEVRLRAQAVEPRLCEPSDDCREVRFEPGKGCVEDWEPDGTPCERTCLVDATCQRGKCVGSRLDCDDGDPCTLDHCDNLLGCQHISDPDRVCESDDPCVVASCDPEGGCRFDPVLDGTSCGEATCGYSMVCIGGVCKASETPEGGACGEATPCQERGICVRGDCVQPSPRQLQSVWSAGAPEGWTLHFDGVGSPLGRVYWVQCGRRTCTLASGQPSGGANVLLPLFADGSIASRGRLLLSDGFLVSSYQRGFLTIHRSDDLQREASLDLGALLPAEALEWDAVEVAAHRDLGFALVEARRDGELVQSWAIAFSIPSGAIEWQVEMNGVFEGLVVDELGQLYFAWLHKDPSYGSAALVSLNRAGGERWRLPSDFSAPLAVASGRLLDGSADIRRVEDGAVEFSIPALNPLFSRSALMGFERGVVLGYPLEHCAVGRLCPTWTPHLLGFSPWRSELEWLLPVAAAEPWERTEPIFTENESILMAQPGAPGASAGAGCKRVYFLQEIRLEEGQPREGFRCELPGDDRSFHGPAALHGGNILIVNHCTQQLEAYPIGDEWATAERGWVTAGGSPGRTGRPR